MAAEEGTRRAREETWSRGAGIADYETRVDIARLHSGRTGHARRALADAQLDAVLVWKEENVRYLTSLRPQVIAGKNGVLNGALFTRDGRAILFVSGGDRDRAEATMPWIGEFHTIPIVEEPGLVRHVATEIIAPVLNRHGLRTGTIGIDLAGKLLMDGLAETCPRVRWVDGDAAMQAARRVKTTEELAIIEEATAIAEAVTATAVAHVGAGVRECEVAGEALRTLYRLGGEYPHVTTPFVASGERMAPPTRLATDKLIRDGDLVFIDIGAMWNGYFGDIGRTVVCGAPGAEQRRVYRAVWDALHAGIDVMRPGATTLDVAAAIRERAAAHGLADRLLSLFIGHGIGCGSNEPPYVGEAIPGAASVVLEPGMVFALEPLIWVPGVPGGGGVRLEDMVAVTDTGARRISRSPYCEALLQ
ncbi:MAG TPA: Xaa-Pro peptidase family protein [bacterium]|nr:Xaa-Pro peptidase family protein [bacterium]